MQCLTVQTLLIPFSPSHPPGDFMSMSPLTLQVSDFNHGNDHPGGVSKCSSLKLMSILGDSAASPTDNFAKLLEPVTFSLGVSVFSRCTSTCNRCRLLPVISIPLLWPPLWWWIWCVNLTRLWYLLKQQSRCCCEDFSPNNFIFYLFSFKISLRVFYLNYKWLTMLR